MNTGNSSGTDRHSGQTQEPAKRRELKKGPNSASDEQRLAEALRANLSRRKDQKKRRKSDTK